MVYSRKFYNQLKNPVHKQREMGRYKITFAISSDFLEGSGSRGRGMREGFYLHETGGKLLHFEQRSGRGDLVRRDWNRWWLRHFYRSRGPDRVCIYTSRSLGMELPRVHPHRGIKRVQPGWIRIVLF